jgi:hypothetical protein
MFETPRLSLPLLQAAQAQKHITVNEALVRLDGLAQLVLSSVSTPVPPGLASDGDCYGVPVGATGAWAGHDQDLAIYSNGGWIFATPQIGWRAWVVDVAANALFGSSGWVMNAVALTQNGASLTYEILEFDHQITAGNTSAAVAAIPADTIVFGVTGRVLVEMSGGLTGWKLGVVGSDDRYGSSLSPALGNWVRGMTSSPLAYYTDTDLVMTAEGSAFVDGEVRFSVSLMRLSAPN